MPIRYSFKKANLSHLARFQLYKLNSPPFVSSPGPRLHRFHLLLAISLAFEAGNPVSAYMKPILGPSLSERLCLPANKKCSKLIGSMTIRCKRMDEALEEPSSVERIFWSRKV